MISPAVIAHSDKYRQAFQAAVPFKHLCIDDFFVSPAAEASLRDFPPFDREFARNEFGEYGGKAVVNNIREISPFYAALYKYLMSPEFMASMSAITGIENLHGDPLLYGGGTHENINGQELDVHVDFNFQIEGGYHRRANLLLYLNKEWDPAWGGAIELHSNPRRPEIDAHTQFNVIFNRAVIFETNEYSWHGFRQIRLPEDRLHLSRKCLSIYLYTPDRPAHEIAGSHGTFYVQWPLSERFEAGRVLSATGVAELRTGYARRDQQIEMYKRLEQRLLQELGRGSADAGVATPPGALSDRAFVIDFGADGNGLHHCRDGWSAPETHHTWAVGPASTLELKRPSIPGTYVLALEVRPHTWPNMPGQRLAVVVNGSEVAQALVSAEMAIECILPWQLLSIREPVSVVFRHPDAARPSEVSGSGDERDLAMLFERLHLFRLPDGAENDRHGFTVIKSSEAQSEQAGHSPSIYVYAGDRWRAGEDDRDRTFFIQWPLAEKFASGWTLSEKDAAELRMACGARDHQIELYQRMEERLGRELGQLRQPKARPQSQRKWDGAGQLVIDFSGAGNSVLYCRDGWSDPESSHTWAVGEVSDLELPQPAISGDYDMAVLVGPHSWAGMSGQRLIVLVNDCEVGRFLAQDIGWVECAIPWSVFSARNPVSVVFRHPDAAKPCDVSASSDRRELAIRFERLRLLRQKRSTEMPVTRDVLQSERIAGE